MARRDLTTLLQSHDPATTKELSLWNLELTSLEPLAAYVHLEDLDASNTSVRDIAALSRMPKLRRLNLANTAIRDISVLAELPHLTWLNLQLCAELPAAAFDQLSQLPRLEHADLLGTKLSSLAPFDGLMKLTGLDIDFTPVGERLSFASGPMPGALPAVSERRKHAEQARREDSETQRDYAQLEKLRARGVEVVIDCMCDDLPPPE